MRNSNLGFVRRNILTTSEQVKPTVYKQLVHPVLEYTSAAWNSASDTATGRLEAVQRRAAVSDKQIKKSNTTGLLQRLNIIQPLSKRRSRRRLAIFSQYHHTNTATLSRYVRAAKHVYSHKHPDQYFITHSNTLHYQRSFFIRTAREWNEIPTSSWLLRPPNI